MYVQYVLCIYQHGFSIARWAEEEETSSWCSQSCEQLTHTQTERGRGRGREGDKGSEGRVEKERERERGIKGVKGVKGGWKRRGRERGG